MSHQLDFTLNRPAIAFRGAVPWHGLGETIQPGDTIDTIQHKAGIEYEVLRSPVRYERPMAFAIPGEPMVQSLQTTERDVLYRGDTGDFLSVVSPRYQIVQPADVIGFYRNLVDRYGFEIEVAGALKNGRKVWALANTKNAFQLAGNDEVKGYLLLATSYDGTMSTQARFTSIRVVCNNTLQFASNEGKADVTVPHNSKFDADKVQLKLQVGESWEAFQQKSAAMAKRDVSPTESTMFLLDVYHDIKSVDALREASEDPRKDAMFKKTLERMQEHLHGSPGAHLASARGMLWGVLNAVTHDVDFGGKSRTPAGRLDSAWFGNGAATKQRAWDLADSMLVQ